MEKSINDTQDIIEKAIWFFMENHKELVLRRIMGSEGLALVAGNNKDINLLTQGTGKAYYNGTEIGSGSGGGDQYLRKDEGAGMQKEYNSVLFDGSILSFKYSLQEYTAGNIAAFQGLTFYDFFVESPNGQLQLRGNMGIELIPGTGSNVKVTGDLSASGKVYLSDSSTYILNNDGMEFHIAAGKRIKIVVG